MKKVLKIIILLFTIWIVVFFILYFNSFSIDIDKNEYVKSVPSPFGTYEIKEYLRNGGATTAYSMYATLYNYETKEERVIYNDYKLNILVVEWIDENTVKINNHIIEDVESDKYDWRKDKKWDEDINYDNYYR